MDLKKLDQVLENSMLPWWQWDIPNNIVTFNKIKVTMLGYRESDFEGCTYQAFTDLLHPDDHQKTMDAMRIVLKGEAELYQTDYRIRNVRNEFQWYLDRGFVIEKNSDGRPVTIRGIVINLGSYNDGIDHAQKILELLNASRKHYESHEDHLLLLCANCKKVKQARQWINVDMDVIHLITDKISHGICPDCLRKLYPDFADKIISEL
jgi:PAS domain S-box-containing protein